jgi:steroid delta-isomerase-like uncharacterized protein
MSDENKTIIRRFAEEVIHRGNLELIPQIIAEGSVVHDPSSPGRPGGVEGARAFVGMLHAGLSDIRYTIEDMIAEGDRVVYRWSLRGRHTGPFMGIPPTGAALDITGVDIFRLEGGKVVESWASADALGMMRQLGLLPPPGAPPPEAPMSGVPGSGKPRSSKPISAVPPTKRN